LAMWSRLCWHHCEQGKPLHWNIWLLCTHENNSVHETKDARTGINMPCPRFQENQSLGYAQASCLAPACLGHLPTYFLYVVHVPGGTPVWGACAPLDPPPYMLQPRNGTVENHLAWLLLPLGYCTASHAQHVHVQDMLCHNACSLLASAASSLFCGHGRQCIE
jgi:hypothetical protein